MSYKSQIVLYLHSIGAITSIMFSLFVVQSNHNDKYLLIELWTWDTKHNQSAFFYRNIHPIKKNYDIKQSQKEFLVHVDTTQILYMNSVEAFLGTICILELLRYFFLELIRHGICVSVFACTIGKYHD